MVRIKIYLIASMLFLFSCTSSGESKMVWNYDGDVNYVTQYMSKYIGLGEVAVGNLKYFSNTETFRNFSDYISKNNGFSGVIYYELNVNEDHFLIAALDVEDSLVNVFEGNDNYKVNLAENRLNDVTQPFLDKGLIISDGYFYLRVEIIAGVVKHRYINVLDELKAIDLIDRINFK